MNLEYMLFVGTSVIFLLSTAFPVLLTFCSALVSGKADTEVLML